MVNAGITFNLWQALSTDDSIDLPKFVDGKVLTQGVYVGMGGDVVAVSSSNVAVLFKAVPTGAILPIGVRRINAQNTTAQNLVALYLI